MKEQVVKKSAIHVTIGLDAQNMPVDMEWQADDSPDAKKAQPCKAMLMSFFDKENKDTLKIDLWTDEMQVVEMDRFMYQTLRGLADTYYKATQNAALAGAMQQFVQYFGEQTELLPKQK